MERTLKECILKKDVSVEVIPKYDQKLGKYFWGVIPKLVDELSLYQGLKAGVST